MFETIRYDVKDNVAWIVLNRPEKLNAFIAKMNMELKEAVKTASHDDNIRCIVITGAGRSFCSGQDLSEVKEDTNLGDVIRSSYTPMINQIVQCEKPIVAAINGAVAGAGLSLALACDFRLASENTKFVNAFVQIGLIPDAGNLYFLPKIIGYAKALEFSILGGKLSAKEASELGIVTEILPSNDWDKEVEQFALRLANMPTTAIGLIKRQLKLGYQLPFHDFMEQEAEGQGIASMSTDFKEGVAAFLEKRKPVFSGK